MIDSVEASRSLPLPGRNFRPVRLERGPLGPDLVGKRPYLSSSGAHLGERSGQLAVLTAHDRPPREPA